MNQPEQLKSMASVAAASGDPDAMIRCRAQDASANPSLLPEADESRLERLQSRLIA